MRKTYLLGALLIVGFGLLFLTFQLFPINKLIILLLEIELRGFLVYLIVFVLILMTHAWRWRIICGQHKIRTNYFRLLGYRIVGLGVSFVTPGPKVGGEPVRAALLQRDGANFSEGLSSVVADKTIELASFGIMFTLSLGAALLVFPLPTTLRVIMGGLALAVTGLLTFGLIKILHGQDPIMHLFRLLRLERIPWLRRYEEEILEFENNITGFYAESPRAFWQALGVAMIAWMFALLEYYVALRLLGVENPSFFVVFLVYSVVGFAYLIPIPMALGSLELTQAGLFALLGLPTVAAAALALMTRGRDLIFTIIGFMLLGGYGFEALTERNK